MIDRETELRGLAAGDIFHGRSPNRASLVCLVAAVDDRVIHARQVTSQDDFRFDRRTGIELDGVESWIDCVAPFPPDIDNTFREMDRKYRELSEMTRNGIEIDHRRIKLTPEEKRALLFIDEHVSANPI